jgi:NAD(P)H-dependent FMN reductase
MTTIVGLAGSLRRKSYNHALLRAARELAPEGTAIEIRTIEGIPVYDGDLEAHEGVPARVEELKNEIAEADGLLIASPEYNNSLPGALKNAVDWLTRPPKDIARVFGGRRVGLIGATPGKGGTRLSQTAWLPVFRTLGMVPYFGKSLYIAGAGKIFDDELHLADEQTIKLVQQYLRGFAEFVGVGRHVGQRDGGE